MIGTRTYLARERLGYEFDPTHASAAEVAAICTYNGSAPLGADR